MVPPIIAAMNSFSHPAKGRVHPPSIDMLLILWRGRVAAGRVEDGGGSVLVFDGE